MALKLSKAMTEDEFVNGYWYAVEVKAFAKEIGVSPVSALRKDELEALVIRFLRTGKVSKPKRSVRQQKGEKDFEIGLRTDLRVVSYINNSETKEFLLAAAKKIDPEFRPKSGARVTKRSGITAWKTAFLNTSVILPRLPKAGRDRLKGPRSGLRSMDSKNT